MSDALKIDWSIVWLFLSRFEESQTPNRPLRPLQVLPSFLCWQAAWAHVSNCLLGISFLSTIYRVSLAPVWTKFPFLYLENQRQSHRWLPLLLLLGIPRTRGRSLVLRWHLEVFKRWKHWSKRMRLRRRLVNVGLLDSRMKNSWRWVLGVLRRL